jgi:hypothetical protein
MNKQLQKPDLSIRELTKILFDTLRDENKLAIKIIVREYQEKQLTKGKYEILINKNKRCKKIYWIL